MKLGAENRKMALMAAGLFAVAILLILRTFVFGPGASPNSSPKNVAAETQGPTAQPTPRRGGRHRASTPKNTKDAAQQQSVTTLDPRLQLALLKTTENVEYQGGDRNIFLAAPEPKIPEPVVPVTTTAKDNTPPTPPPPPPPPPINLKFFGFASRPGEPRSVFLSQGEDVFVAKEGDIVNRRYKIMKIMPNAVDVQDMLTNNRQNIPLTQG